MTPRRHKKAGSSGGGKQVPAPTSSAPPRWPSVLMLLAGLISAGGMLYARQAEGKAILDGLLVVGVGLGVLIVALLARAVGNHLWRPGLLGPLAALLSGLGAGVRIFLLSTVPRRAQGPAPIVMHREILLGVPVTVAAFALAISAWSVYRTISLPPGGLSEPGRRNDLVAGVLAMAGALYTLAPLLASIGIPLNHWSFLGLVVLGLVAFGLATAYEKLLG